MTPPIIDFEAATSDLDHWQSQREELRRGLHQRLGHLPALPSEVQSETIDKRNHACGVIEKLRLHSGNNSGIPAWFATPRNLKEPGPAVLWCHWHGGEYSLGKQELFEQKHTPQSPLQCFLEMGLSILCIDAYGFGERNGQDLESCGDHDQEGEHSLFKHFLWQGSSLWGRMLWDDRLALRYLQQRPEVDSKRIAAAGLSMGATRTQWLMALEESLACGVAMACMVRYRDLMHARALRLHGMYFYVPGLLEYCDLESVMALAAPRPLLCLNGADDLLSPAAGVTTVEKCVSKVYDMYGQKERFRSDVIPAMEHECSPAMWAAMRSWISQI
ncbi:acetylxylan esterase [bacterium]|nr:acetylxylan esterase [Verrucomicrobiota bacterium]MDB4589430.1 acetylxylan esterase [bacterium]MDB4619627.1 acetylxylan esterase [bacterium]MDB4744863.1 acetylxylan esterase [Verrucomicrobiota bacterium]